MTLKFSNLKLVSSHLLLSYCSISPNIREGLLETFYGVYEKDPDKVFKLEVSRHLCFLFYFSFWGGVVWFWGVGWWWSCTCSTWPHNAWLKFSLECRSCKHVFKWVFWCLLVTWLLSDALHYFSLIGSCRHHIFHILFCLPEIECWDLRLPKLSLFSTILNY